jgi:hypothetical protein
MILWDFEWCFVKWYIKMDLEYKFKLFINRVVCFRRGNLSWKGYYFKNIVEFRKLFVDIFRLIFFLLNHFCNCDVIQLNSTVLSIFNCVTRILRVLMYLSVTEPWRNQNGHFVTCVARESILQSSSHPRTYTDNIKFTANLSTIHKFIRPQNIRTSFPSTILVTTSKHM